MRYLLDTNSIIYYFNGLTAVTHNTGDFVCLGVKTLAITMKP
jgi:hypothetical protein